jgi:hypothetical protein
MASGRTPAANNSQFPLASGSFVAKVVLQFHPPAAAVFPPSRRGKAPLRRDDGRFNQKDNYS